MTVQTDAIAAGRTIHGGEIGETAGAYYDTLPNESRDNDIRRWNPTLSAWEWVSDNSVTFCPGFRRAAGDES
ncbi:MAG: hypothetical protein CL489_01065 [Acidobacteria bacterium]|jgi:hypothetical protein|nr:hypothetical protein [Acidobacteriota bacterium]|tara:strand:- start:4090 stop:4305 length:216 start_codon:yes stop_codon:yes gene_type:complete